MKGNHWFIAGIIVFLVLMFAIECRLPKKFVWNPTFSHYDKQPFGCAVFDSLLSSSLPKGYSLSRKTFYELEQEDTTLRRGILVVTDNLHLTDVDVEAMLKMAGRGDRIMLVGSSFSRILKDTLGFECSYSYFSPSALKKYAEMENNNELTKEQKLASIQKEVEEATALELPTLEMNLAVIATMTTLGTLVGLLGTVLLMIKSFAALATATGAPDSVALSTGISEALVNTAFGIATGACAVISYNFFTSKIDKITYAIDEVGFSIVQSYAANHSK